MKGETISWMMPFSEGGGSGRWARFIAPLLEKQLGAAIQFKFVPGGDSKTGASLHVARAKPNGAAITGTSDSTQFPFEFEGNAPAVPC